MQGEFRMLMMAAMVMLGFQYRSTFEPGLAKLPEVYAELRLGAIGLTLLTLGLLASPAATTRAALLPFALSIGLDVVIAGVAIAGAALGWTMGGAAALLALLLWYGLRVGDDPSPGLTGGGRFTGIALTPKASTPGRSERNGDRALAEMRLVLPGAQALLGLQVSVALMRGFDTLPPVARTVYLISLGLMALALILLVTPAAYHRVREGARGFARLADGFLVAGMAVLALALSGDVYVAATRVARFTDAAAAAAAATALLFYFLWFAVPMLRRRSAEAAPKLESRWTRG